MRRYSARRIPPGTHTHKFWFLSADEQRAQVKKMMGSGLKAQSIADLTGLKVTEIAAIMASKL